MKKSKFSVLVLGILSAIFFWTASAAIVADNVSYAASADFYSSAEEILKLRKFDPREELTAVKDQGETSLCWAYSAINASETAVLKKRLGVKQDLNFNPKALAYRRYVRKADPLGNNADFYGSTSNWLTKGGSIEYSSALLGMWQGPVSGKYDADVWQNSLYRLENANLIASGLSDEARIEEIKRAIAEYGAVTASCFYDGGRNLYYNDKEVKNGEPHAIVLVGWDDDISKESFRPKQTATNGGWLVKNSYSDNEYFWLTYESKIASSTAWTFDYSPKDTYDYNYYYDDNSENFGLIKLRHVANVFEAKKGTVDKEERLKAVNVGFSGNDVRVNIKVYADISGWGQSYVESGKLVAEQTQTFKYGGYHTIKLDNHVKLSVGSYFSIVAEVSNEKGDAYVNVVQTQSKKPSYAKSSSGYDYIAGSCIARLKAYTKLSDAEDGCTEHDYGQIVLEKVATCIATGRKSYYKCSVCNKFFDENKNETTLEALTIPVNSDAHDFGDMIAASSANCVTAGTKAHKDCKLCGKHFDESGKEITDLTIPANGDHDYGAWVSNGDGTHTRTCKRDSGHKENGTCSGGTATCEKKAVCSVCGAEYGGTAAHNLTKYGGNDGTGHWDTCSTCDNKLNVEAHTPDRAKPDETNPVKCTKCGYIITPAGHYEHTAGGEWRNSADGTYHYHECTYVGCSEILDKANHSGGTATCTTKAICSVCGAEYGEKLGHDYGEAKYTWTSDDTCKAERVCRHDKTHIESETVTATETEIKAATCKEKGKKKYTATFVNTAFKAQEKEVDIDFTEHTYGGWIPEEPATTEKSGTKAHKDCTVCGKHFDKDGNEITDLSIAKIVTYTVTVNGESKVCKEGEEVTVTAEEKEGKEFKGWKDASGKVVGTEKIYKFTVKGETTLTAVYEDLSSPGVPETPENPEKPEAPEEKEGLSGGAIAGIVIGSVAVTGLGGFAIFRFVVKKKSFADLIAAIKGLFAKGK